MKKFLLLILALFLLVGTILFFSPNSKMDKSKTTEKSNVNISYTIDNNRQNYNSEYSEKGIYYNTLNQPDSPHYYTIAMGKKTTGGNSINIKTVNIDDEGNVEIIVQENTPAKGEVTTMAITYPTCMITLDKLPTSIIVKNTEGKAFKNINF